MQEIGLEMKIWDLKLKSFRDWTETLEFGTADCLNDATPKSIENENLVWLVDEDEIF